jgi:hypothetical protein
VLGDIYEGATPRNVTQQEDSVLRGAVLRGATIVSKGRLAAKGTT